MNQIILGDCLEEMPKLEAKSIDMVITDPPYFLPVNSYVGTMEDGYEQRTLADTSILKGFFKQVFKELARLTKDSSTWYVFCDSQSYPIFYECAFPYCKYVRQLIWDKQTSVYGYTWRHQYESIMWCERENSKRIPTGDGDVIKCRGVKQEDRYHPAEKPVELLKKLIEKHSHYESVFDPFCGSGSTNVAAIQMSKNHLGIELDETYHKIAVERVTNCKSATLEVFS